MSDNYVVVDNIQAGGYGLICKVVMRDKALPVISKAIYAYLCSYTGAGLTAWPGRRTACEDLGINKDTWTKYIKPLKEQDYIRITRRSNGKGVFTSNLYTVVTSPCPKLSDTVAPDTVVSDMISNISLEHDHNNDIANRLSTTKQALLDYSKGLFK